MSNYDDDEYFTGHSGSNKIAIAMMVLLAVLLFTGSLIILLTHFSTLLVFTFLALSVITGAMSIFIYNNPNWQALATKYKLATAIFLVLALLMLTAVPALLYWLPSLATVFPVLLAVTGTLLFCLSLWTHYQHIERKSGHAAIHTTALLAAILGACALIPAGIALRPLSAFTFIGALMSIGVVVVALAAICFLLYRSRAKWENLGFGYKLAAAVAITLGALAVLVSPLLMAAPLFATSTIISSLLTTLLSTIGVAVVVLTTVIHSIHIAKQPNPGSGYQPLQSSAPGPVAVPNQHKYVYTRLADYTDRPKTDDDIEEEENSGGLAMRNCQDQTVLAAYGAF